MTNDRSARSSTSLPSTAEEQRKLLQTLAFRLFKHVLYKKHSTKRGRECAFCTILRGEMEDIREALSQEQSSAS